MKILSIYAANPGCDYNLGRLSKFIYEIFTELGEEIIEVNLLSKQLPFYNGGVNENVAELISQIKSSNGIIFIFTTNSFAPCGIFQIFLEHLSHPSNGNCLAEKNVFVITASSSGGESSSLAYLSKIVLKQGGYDAVKLGLQDNMLASLESNNEFRVKIEKYVEDYYRVIRQNRQYIIPSDIVPIVYNTVSTPNSGNDEITIKKEQPARTRVTEEYTPKISLAELQKKVNLDSFTKRQEDDINEITQFFANKIKESGKTTKGKPISEELQPQQPPVPRQKTCRQMTQNLPHYYQGHLSEGLECVIQISISGEENFDGYLDIKNAECTYYDGVPENPDIAIICGVNVWLDCLKGKYSAQKAFMIGHLKVRGNFILLTKFDQLFKLS